VAQHHIVKICQSVAKILNFSIFQDGGRCHNGFSNLKIFWLTVSGGTRRITVPNFVKIGRSIAMLQFFKMAAADILDF